MTVANISLGYSEDPTLYSEKVKEMIRSITPYNLPKNKAAYKIICDLDDYMWSNDETDTEICIFSSEGYELEVKQITEFVNEMMRNPVIVYQRNPFQGIAVKVFFIKEY